MEGIWKYMGPALGSFRADQINDATMNEFLEARQRKAIRRRGRPLSNGTLLQDVTIAQTILNYAKKKNLIDISVHLMKPESRLPRRSGSIMARSVGSSMRSRASRISTRPPCSCSLRLGVLRQSSN